MLVALPAAPAAASACDPGAMTIRWIGRGATDSWFDRNNWLAPGAAARLPGPGDNVCVPDQAVNISITYDTNVTTGIKTIETHEELVLGTGELDLTDTSAPSQISDLTMSGGTLGGGSDLTVTSSLDFQSGRMAGNGATVIGPGASMTIGGAAAHVLTRDLTVDGDLHWTGGDIRSGQGAVFRNNGSVDVNLGGAAALRFTQGGAPPTIVNAGTLSKQGGNGGAGVEASFVNLGTVNLGVGTFAVDALDNGAGADMTAASGTTLDVAGALEQAGSLVLVGKANVTAASFHQSGGVTSLRSASSAVHSAPGAITADGGRIEGVGTLDAVVTVNGGTVAPGLSPGILSGSGPYTQGAGATLAVEIAGPGAGTGYDRLALSGAANLGGALSIATGAGFSPAVGDTFRILTAPSVSGSFGAVNGANIAGGRFYDVGAAGGAVTLRVVSARVSVGNASVTEGNAGTRSVNFPVTLDRASPAVVSVTLATANGSAVAPSDYTARNVTVSFAPGDTSRAVPVAVNGDTTVEHDEFFRLNVTGATNALVADRTGVGTIVNDDVPPPPPTIPPPTTPPPTTPPTTTPPPTTPPPTLPPPPPPPIPPPTTPGPTGGPTVPPPTSHPPVSPSASPTGTRSPSASPTASAVVAPSVSPSPSGSPGAGPSGSAPPPTAGPPTTPPSGNPDRSDFVKSIDDAGQVPWNAGAVARDLLLALLLLLLILFPSILFNSTLEEHYDEVRGWFRFGRDPDAPSRMAAVRRSPWFRVLAFVGFFALGALLYSFLDPTFGFSRRSLALFLGLLVGLLVITLIAEIPVILVLRKHADRGRIRLLAGSLVVGVVCVAVSRLAGFKPGYLYGLIAGAAFQRTLSKDEEGRSVLAGTIALLLTSVGAWLLWIPVSHAANQPGAGTWTLIFDAVLAAVFVTGLEAVFIGMLPLRFLDGHRMYVWNRVVWGVLFVVGAFGFVHLLLRPGSGYFQHSGNTPLFTILGLFLAFGVVSVSFWAYFAFRKPRESKEEAPETAVPPGSEPATE